MARKNIIGIYFDFDGTMVPNFSEDGMLRDHGIEPEIFWGKMLPEYYASRQESLLSFERDYNGASLTKEQKRMGVLKQSCYIHLLIDLAEPGGPLEGLSKALLREYGQQLVPFSGLWESLEALKQSVNSHPEWSKHNIELELYIVSNGITDMIVGSLGKYSETLFNGIYANELLPEGDDIVNGTVSRIVGPMFDSVKARVVYETHKGPGFGVNVRVEKSKRHISEGNMIAVFDGFSDIPLAATVLDKKGRALGVYGGSTEEEVQKAREGAYILLEERRVESVHPADYRKGSELMEKLEEIIGEIADRIVIKKHAKSILMELPFKEEIETSTS